MVELTLVELTTDGGDLCIRWGGPLYPAYIPHILITTFHYGQAFTRNIINAQICPRTIASLYSRCPSRCLLTMALNSVTRKGFSSASSAPAMVAILPMSGLAETIITGTCMVFSWPFKNRHTSRPSTPESCLSNI